MSFERKLVGEPITYKGRRIEARYCGPDLLCHVDGAEVGNFYENVAAAHAAGKRYVDQQEKEKKHEHRD